MIRFSINILNYRFRAELSRKRGAPGISFLPSRDILKDVEGIRKIRSGNKASRFVRLVLERVNLKAILGGNLALSVMLFGVLGPTGGALAQMDPEINTLSVSEQPLTTEITIQYPVNPVIVNQGYHLFHPGMDFDGLTGDPVKPIMKGRVIKREFSRWGYGNSVLIDHENSFQSLYAHLSKINVLEGDAVDTKSVIGAVGSSGRSTGDHLHLEVYKSGRSVNPRVLLPR